MPSVGGVRIFSGITQYITSHHMYFFFSSVLIIMFMAQSGARMPIKINNRLYLVKVKRVCAYNVFFT